MVFLHSLWMDCNTETPQQYAHCTLWSFLVSSWASSSSRLIICTLHLLSLSYHNFEPLVQLTHDPALDSMQFVSINLLKFWPVPKYPPSRFHYEFFTYQATAALLQLVTYLYDLQIEAWIKRNWNHPTRSKISQAFYRRRKNING